MSVSSIGEQSLELHRKLRGKIQVTYQGSIETPADLALVYTPGVGAVSSYIAEHPEAVNDLTWRKNVVAVVSDGSAVLGLGNIGPVAALPVMEGKCAIFKRFAKVNAVPIVLSTQDPDEIVRTVIAIAPSFGAIQLEDISAPRCFAIEERLHDALDIPVMHDDQHGTAIVTAAALLNAVRVVDKQVRDLRIVLHGAGAAGTAIAKMLLTLGVKEIVVVDRKGAIYRDREELSGEKALLAKITNGEQRKGGLQEIVEGADVLIGVSVAGAFTPEVISRLAPRSIVFGLANPVPEITPDEAHALGVTVVATGRSDYPNQVNNALCYPGLFRGMLDGNISKITDEIKMRVAHAIASCVASPTALKIIPSIFEEDLH